MNVLFGTGQLGLALMEKLHEKGEPIRLVNRSGQTKAPLPTGVTLVQADATDARQIEQVTADATVVFIALDVLYQHWDTFYEPMMGAFVEAMSGSKARLVFGDNMYAYGNTLGKPMMENAPYLADTKKGGVRARTASLLLAAHEAGKVRATIGRASDFIGPRITKGFFGLDFLNALHAGKKVSLVGNPDRPHTFTYIDDFAAGLLKLGESEEALGKAWHIPNAPAITPRQWLGLFEQQTGKKARIQVAGKNTLRVLGLFNPLLKELVELSYQFEQPYLVDHTGFARRFELPYTEPEEVVARTLRWYNEQLRPATAINVSALSTP
ncbi:NAD-dependent epimerase/dehydratase family protein [Persicitalea sp.]|uniref:NAD-dependent epimerase/dehydratase family protein n=1 Tax=Persicitalea sp. TaxID=3100273 RepID=UPI0035934F3A